VKVSALLICLRHADVATWHHAFLVNRDVRRAYGARVERIFFNAEHPAEVWVLIDWDDTARAQLYARSDDLIDLFEQEGVNIEPRLWLLNEMADRSGTIPLADERGIPPDNGTESR